MEIPLPDLIDRYTILCLKKLHGAPECVNSELREYEDALRNYEDIESFIRDLLMVNTKIWALEADIRNGQEAVLGLDEIGRRALAIRDLNRIRIALKNSIATHFGVGWREIKILHRSAVPDSVNAQRPKVSE